MGDKRSPNYPAVGLGRAIEDARLWWQKQNRAPVSAEIAVKAWGYNTLNGPGRSRVSALKKYGLIEDTTTGLKMTERGMAVSLKGPSDPDYLKAVRAAALEPDLFRELSQEHISASEEAIAHFLMMKKKFIPLGAKQAAKAFKDTIAIAKLEESSYDGAADGNGSEKQAVLAVGDTVQWENQGVLRFEAPRKILGFSDDGSYAFVEGSATGVPVQELQKAKVVEVDPAKPPTNPFTKFSEGAAKTAVSTVFPLPGGNRVQVILDRKVTSKEYDEALEPLFKLLKVVVVEDSKKAE